jgi:hypothetical protein
MSRTPFSTSCPRRGGTFRPQLEALEDRFAPGSLLGPSPGSWIGPDIDARAHELETDGLAPFAGSAARSQGLTQAPKAIVNLADPGPVPAEALPLSDTAARDDGATTDSAALGVGLTDSNWATPTTRPVVDFATRSIVFGESTVMRTDQGVTAHLTATGLAPGAYTFWMKVEAPGQGPVAGWLAGHVVGQGGNLNFSAHVSAGEVLSRNPDFPSGPLQDPLHAKITLVVRSHGPADPGQIYEQTHTFQPTTAVNYLVSVHAPPA